MITIALIIAAFACAASIEKSLRAEEEKVRRDEAVKEVMQQFDTRFQVLEILKDPLEGIERRRQYEKAVKERICRG